MSRRHRAAWRRGQRLITLVVATVLLYVAVLMLLELLHVGRP